MAAAAGLATVARAIAMVGEAGNSALAIYDTVKNPRSAIINILGMVVGVGAVAKASRDGTGLAKIAKMRRDMDPTVVASMGKVFQSNSDKLSTVMKFCRWS